MKEIFFLVGLLLAIGCIQSGKKENIPHFKEKELSFLHLRNGYYDISNDWIKQPENILMLHETFKKIGYRNIITTRVWDGDEIWGLDVWKRPKDLVDSLLITYSAINDAPKYYNEFWLRRIKEKNDAIVYQVLDEFRNSMNYETEEFYSPELVNDTLYRLMSYEFPYRKLTAYEKDELLKYLIEIELYQSAYNLISGENGVIYNEGWKNKIDETIEKFVKSETNKWPWFMDLSK